MNLREGILGSAKHGPKIGAAVVEDCRSLVANRGNDEVRGHRLRRQWIDEDLLIHEADTNGGDEAEAFNFSVRERKGRGHDARGNFRTVPTVEQ